MVTLLGDNPACGSAASTGSQAGGPGGPALERSCRRPPAHLPSMYDGAVDAICPRRHRRGVDLDRLSSLQGLDVPTDVLAPERVSQQLRLGVASKGSLAVNRRAAWTPAFRTAGDPELAPSILKEPSSHPFHRHTRASMPSPATEDAWPAQQPHQPPSCICFQSKPCLPDGRSF